MAQYRPDGLRVVISAGASALATPIEGSQPTVRAAATIEEAIRLLDRAFDVVLLDADLNGLSSAPVAAALAVRRRPFVLATAYDDVSGFPEEVSAPVVRKPYNVDQIAAALARATGRAA